MCHVEAMAIESRETEGAVNSLTLSFGTAETSMANYTTNTGDVMVNVCKHMCHVIGRFLLIWLLMCDLYITFRSLG